MKLILEKVLLLIDRFRLVLFLLVEFRCMVCMCMSSGFLLVKMGCRVSVVVVMMIRCRGEENFINGFSGWDGF